MVSPNKRFEPVGCRAMMASQVTVHGPLLSKVLSSSFAYFAYKVAKCNGTLGVSVMTQTCLDKHPNLKPCG